MITRQLVHVWSHTRANKDKPVERTKETIVLPGVFSTGIRLDIVNEAHKNISKNRRQGHAVNYKAGMKHSAESWGTGRAVSRIPRVGGSGTHRSGQGAFGNMCRKGRMFAPIRIWRRWHRKVNIKQKRYATASALAASAILPLVQSRGHRVNEVPELPLVVDNKVEGIERTKEAVQFLKDIGAYPDVKKVVDTIGVRAGLGKLRNRRYRSRRGPLIVYNGENVPLLRAVRNIPGVETLHVSRLNLLQLAPGGHVGRFIIWTADAFRALDKIFGSHRYAGIQKKGFTLPHEAVTNPDLARVINSDSVQSAIRHAHTRQQVHHHIQKKNPLNNAKAMHDLNPNAEIVRKQEAKVNEENRKKREEILKSKRKLPAEEKKVVVARKASSRKWIHNLHNQVAASFQRAQDEELGLKKLERQIE
jgi:large subunit ribosomal protein L4e